MFTEIEAPEAGATYESKPIQPTLLNPGNLREDQHATFAERVRNAIFRFTRDYNRVTKEDAVPAKVRYNLGETEVSGWTLKAREEAPEAAVKAFDEYVKIRKESADKVAAKRATANDTPPKSAEETDV